ncbi:hypothetical protein Tco_1284498 [Tanacetum coccineum]
MGDTIAQTRFENVSKLSNDSLLASGNTLRSNEDSLKCNELMELCTNLQTKFLDLEKTKTTQANEIASLKRRVRSLKRKVGSRTHKLRRLLLGLFEQLEVEPLEMKKRKNENDVEEVVDVAQDSTAATTMLLKKDNAKMDVDYQLAERLQAQEQEELSVEEKAKLFQQLLEQRRKHFAAKSAEEKRNKPPTQAQQRKIIAFKRVKTFVDFRTNLVEDEEDVTIDVIPLAVNSPRIVDWKIHKEGKKSYYQIIRADGKSQIYGSTRPVKSMDYLLWKDMKIMFKPHVEDEVWKLQNRYKVLQWKLYDSYGVHFLRMQSMPIYMLVEKK